MLIYSQAQFNYILFMAWIINEWVVQVANMAQLQNIYLRTGCFCNPGACQRHLKLSDSDLMAHFKVLLYLRIASNLDTLHFVGVPEKE